MLAKIKVDNLDGAEQCVKEILEHIDAIKQLQQELCWSGNVEVSIVLEKSKTASGN